MQGFREIEARAGAARAPCVAYWLLAFVYLMIQLFPVIDVDRGAGYQNRGTTVVAVAGDDWAPPPGVEETPLPAATPPALPQNVSATLRPIRPRPVATSFIAGFDPRGPPVAPDRIAG